MSTHALRHSQCPRNIRLSRCFRTVIALCGGLFAWLVCFQTQAHIVVHMELNSLQRRAATIVRGRVVTQRAVWKDKRIVTLSTVQVERCYKGTCRDKTIAVEQPGGTVENLVMRVFGVKHLALKSQVVLFLHSHHGVDKHDTQVLPVHQVVGLSQGILQVVKKDRQEFLVQDLSGLVLRSSHTQKHGGVNVYAAPSVYQRLQSLQ